ncbi:ttr-18 [Pristionchus pacificus]|uniref:Ttr-18 n=1 Tax=Pristionchus pacificus TaxID=54126 RepID=A0A454XYV2_PRIPA|nr:ttr-18 [Pristionchus pacificus]|eukprot:PDM81548.1 ttr-18 [Pristionchus pacificus]
MKLALVLALVALEAAQASPFGTVQSASVKGKLTCNGQPAGEVKVKLYDVDTFDPDDLMAEGVSKADGTFTLAGSEKENTKIDPKVNIYHKCNHKGICLKKIAIVIPKDYVSEGEVAERTFDIGEINLAGRFSGESVDCIN